MGAGSACQSDRGSISRCCCLLWLERLAVVGLTECLGAPDPSLEEAQQSDEQGQ